MAGRGVHAAGEHDLLDLLAGALHELSTRSRSSRKRPSTYAETISGSLESGRPTPTRTRVKSSPPSSRRSDFSPL